MENANMAKKILVIDDDRLVLRTLSKYLKDCGYFVIAASNGTEALEKAEDIAVDLIISDIRMPGMSGIEAIKRITQRNNVPAIVITGYAGDDSYQLDESLKINDFLYKPFEIDDFIKIVKKNLEPRLTYARAHSRILANFPVKLKFKERQYGLPEEIAGETLTLSEGVYP